MIKSATDKRVQLQDLRKAGDEIRSSTRWNDPVVLLTAIAKIAEVNAHKVTVEENEGEPKKRDLQENSRPVNKRDGRQNKLLQRR